VTDGCQTLTKREHLVKHEGWCKAQSKSLEQESEKLESKAAELERAQERIRELERGGTGARVVAPPPSPIAAAEDNEPADVKPDIAVVSFPLNCLPLSILTSVDPVAPLKRRGRSPRRRKATEANEKWVLLFLEIWRRFRVGRPEEEEGCFTGEEESFWRATGGGFLRQANSIGFRSS